MRRNLRWITLVSLAANLLLLQALTDQSSQVTDLRQEAALFHGVIAELEAEAEAINVELAVLNVLDSHRLRVSPERRQAVARKIIEVGERYDLEPELILAIIFTESSFNIEAESHLGAMGLMQLMPATASQLAAELSMEWREGKILTDPEVNILLGSFYLRKLIHRFEDLDTALAAYNVGPNRLRGLMALNGRVPRRYASKVQRVTTDLRHRFF